MAAKFQQFGKGDVEVLEVKPLYDGYFKMVNYRFKHKMFNGGWSRPIDREVFERGHAVAVLPYDPVTNEFVFLQQFRVGALEQSDSPWLLEIVAGIIEPGEAQEEVCHREAEEEAGLAIEQLVPVLDYLPSPGGCTERVSIYIGKVDATGAGGVYGLDDEDEDICVEVVSEQQALAWLDENKYDNSAILIAMQWFALNKEKVLKQFSNE